MSWQSRNKTPLSNKLPIPGKNNLEKSDTKPPADSLCEVYRKNIEELKINLNRKEEECLLANQQNERYQRIIKALESQLKAEQKEKKSIFKEYEEMRNDVSMNKGKLWDFHENNTKLEKDRKDLIELNQDLKKKLENLSFSYQDESLKLKKNFEAEKAILHERIETQEKLNEKLNDKICFYEDLNESSLKKIDELERIIEEYKIDLNSMNSIRENNVNLSSILKTTKSENDTLKIENLNKQNEIDVLNQEKKRLQETLNRNFKAEIDKTRQTVLEANENIKLYAQQLKNSEDFKSESYTNHISLYEKLRNELLEARNPS